MADAAPRHRLLAILAADAAGYSRLMVDDEHAALAALEQARDVFRRETGAHSGRVVDTAGDSVLAVFDTAAGAVDCAVAVQRELAAGSAPAPARSLPFRIGVHLGDVIEKDDGTVYGNGVNVAARLQSLAPPGEIWISDAVRAALGGPHARRLRDQGEHRVKNIDEPVHAFAFATSDADLVAARRPARWRPRSWALWTVGALAIAGVAVSALLSSGSWRAADAARDVRADESRSLAIAGFAGVANDPRSGELAEQLRSELQAELTGPFHRHTLSVVAIEAAPPGASAVALARTAGARFLLEGSVRASERGHRGVVEIVDVATSTRHWSREVPLDPARSERDRSAAVGNLGDDISRTLFALQAKRVVALPVERLSVAELAVRASATYDSDPTLKGIEQALSLADRALALDPNSIVAIMTRAFLLANRYDEVIAPDHDAYARELDALTARALAIDGRDPFAWSLRTIALRWRGQWPAALEAADTLLRIVPGTSFAVVTKADLLLASGRPADALQQLETQVRDVDDSWRLILSCHAHLLLARPTDALPLCERSVGGDPRWWSAHLYLAAARAQTGNVEQARESIAVIRRLSPAQTMEHLRTNWNWRHPEYQRLAEASLYPGLRKAGLPER